MINFLLDQGASLVAINHDDKMPIDVAADSDIRYVLQQKMTEAGNLFLFDTHQSKCANTGYTEDVLGYIRASVAKTMLADLKDSVRSNRSLDIKDKYGSTAVRFLPKVHNFSRGECSWSQLSLYKHIIPITFCASTKNKQLLIRRC